MRKTTLLATTALLAMGVAEAQADFALTVLHINDVHSRIESINKYNSTCDAESEAAGECFGGIARIKTRIDERRAALDAEGRAYLVVDAGDQFQGSLYYSTYKGTAAAEFMNAIGFDAMAVGNHEFDDGPEKLAEFADLLDAPIVSSNIDVSAAGELADDVADHIVIEVGGEKIGIVSALAVDTVETSSPGPDVAFSSPEETLTALVEKLEADGINKIIAVTHVGLPRDMEIAAAVDGIDVVVGGHSHTLLSNVSDQAQGPYPVMVKNPAGSHVPIVQAFAYSKYLGEIDIVFDDEGHVISASGEPHLLDASVEPDADMLARVQELGAPIEELKNQVVAEAVEAIDGEREVCRTQECAMGNLVAEAMLDRVKDQGVSIAIQNGGGLRASIDAGEVTMGEVLTVLPFQNLIATFELKGADVIAALENGVSQVEEVKGRFPQVAGLRYEWNRATAPNEGRIVKVEVLDGDAWVPIDPEATYGVTANDYMRSGGDGYSVLADNAMNAYDFGPGLEVVVADYLAKAGPYTPITDGRIVEIK